jgi:hypothetical protein
MASVKSDDSGRQQYTRRLWVRDDSTDARARALVPHCSSRRRCRRALLRSCPRPAPPPQTTQKQLEEDLADDLKWTMQVKEVLFSGKSEFQEVDLIHTGPFGRVS